MTDRITITSGRLTASVDPLGAELISLTDGDGRELMTDADPAFWSGHAPLLFPLVGKPAGEVIRVDGHEYPMKQHGFARKMPFAITETTADAATFVLRDDASTRTHYPFAFVLTVGFAIEEATLTVAVTIDNPGAAPLPASFGFHPAFAWPLPYGQPREDHRIIFDADEPEQIRRIGTDGTVLPDPRPTPLDRRTLRLDDALFVEDALIWDRLRAQSVTYGASSGPQLRIAFPDTPQLGIWTKPGARFICVEPWHGLADPQGFTGDFREKPGVFEVAPGEAKRISMAVTLVA